MHIGAGNRKMAQKGLRKRAVAPGAIQRDVPGLGRERDERTDASINSRQTAREPGRAGRLRLRQVLRERVVAAGVENHDAAAGRARQISEQGIEWHQSRARIGLLLNPGVDRKQIVLATDLQAVAGEIEQGEVVLLEGLGETLKARQELRPAHIQAECDLIPEGLQLGPARSRASLAGLVRLDVWAYFALPTTNALRSASAGQAARTTDANQNAQAMRSAHGSIVNFGMIIPRECNDDLAGIARGRPD
jgi:hypothetical protein